LTVEHTPRVSENRVLRKIFEHKRDEVTGEYRRLEVYDQYSSQNVNRVMKSRGMRWTGHVAHMVDRRRAYRVGGGETEGKCPLVRPKRRWEENIKTDLQEVECGHGLDCWGKG
jgi:hypothetical protein